MNNREFIKLAKDKVEHYTFDVLGYEQTSIEIFVVWQAKVLLIISSRKPVTLAMG